jgi:hypothetical protein
MLMAATPTTRKQANATIVMALVKKVSISADQSVQSEKTGCKLRLYHAARTPEACEKAGK